MMQRPKGTRDIFGKEIVSLRKVEEVLRKVFSQHGFREIETPMFESLELFTIKSGETIIKQLYVFEDKAGKKLALRPELTAPVVRAYCEKLRSEPKPVKLCYFGSCFRYEEPQAKRWRQFHQAGAEIIGSPHPMADAEIIELASEVFWNLGLNFDLRIGSLAILRSFLNDVGVEEKKQDPLLRALDSGERSRIEEEVEKTGLGEKEKRRLYDLIELKGDKKVLEEARGIVGESGKCALDNLWKVLEILDGLGIGYTVDLGIARGLDYYTGCVYEFYCGGWQVAGGGRYDCLVELIGGEQVPATGIGFGMDRIASLIHVEEESPPQFLVVPVSEELQLECMKIARDLRRKGYSVEVELMGRKLSKALEYADARKIPKVIMVGKKELEGNVLTLRDMRTGEQKAVRLEEI